jgi:hypothetical protein
MARQPLGGLGRLIFRGFTIKLRHTTLGRTPLDEGPARHRDLYLTTHNTHNKQTSMPYAGFFFLSGVFPLWSIFILSLYHFVLHVTFYVPYYRAFNKHNTNIHASGGIRTHNPSKRAAVDPRLRPRGRWDRRPGRYTHRKTETDKHICEVGGIVNSNLEQDIWLGKNCTTKVRYCNP